jgi:hypothetical protein
LKRHHRVASDVGNSVDINIAQKVQRQVPVFRQILHAPRGKIPVAYMCKQLVCESHIWPQSKKQARGLIADGIFRSHVRNLLRSGMVKNEPTVDVMAGFHF